MSTKKKTMQPQFVTEFDAKLKKLAETIQSAWDNHYTRTDASEKAIYDMENVSWKLEQKRDKARRKLIVQSNAAAKKAAGKAVGAIWTEHDTDWWDTEGEVPSEIKVVGEKDMVHTAKTMVEAKLISKALKLADSTPAKKANPKK